MNIYRITNSTNGDFYIGKTVRSVQDRFREHLRSSGKTHLSNAIKYYGPDAFVVDVIEEVTGDLDERERHWIAELSPKYNMTEGGDGGTTRIYERTDEIREKYRRAKLGHKQSEESKRKKARYGADNHFYGKKHTEESRKKMSESSKGQVAWNRKPITVDGVEYQSQTELCRALRIGKPKARKLYYDNERFVGRGVSP